MPSIDWLVIYSTILVEEHYIFRRGSFKNYNLERYNDNTNLPAGWAAAFATCCGAAGTVLGMSQEFKSFHASSSPEKLS